MTSFAAALFAMLFAVAALGKLDGWREWRAAAHQFFPRYGLAPFVTVAFPANAWLVSADGKWGYMVSGLVGPNASRGDVGKLVEMLNSVRLG